MDEIIEFLNKVLNDLKDDSKPSKLEFNSNEESADVTKFRNYLMGGLIIIFMLGFVKGLYDGENYRKDQKEKKFRGLKDKDFFVRKGSKASIVKYCFYVPYKVTFTQYGQVLAKQECSNKVKKKLPRRSEYEDDNDV